MPASNFVVFNHLTANLRGAFALLSDGNVLTDTETAGQTLALYDAAGDLLATSGDFGSMLLGHVDKLVPSTNGGFYGLTTDGGTNRILYRKFNADLTPVESSDQQVNTATSGNTGGVSFYLNHAFALSGGGFGATTDDPRNYATRVGGLPGNPGTDGEFNDIRARFFNASGVPTTTDFYAQATGSGLAGDQQASHGVQLSNGNVAFVYDDTSYFVSQFGGTTTTGAVAVSIFDTGGNVVNTPHDFDTGAPGTGHGTFYVGAGTAIAALSTGGFVAAYGGYFDNNRMTVYAQRFDAGGNAVGSRITAPDLSEYATLSVIGTPDGGFILGTGTGNALPHDLTLYKYNASGTLVSSTTLDPIAGAQFQSIRELRLGADGQIFVALAGGAQSAHDLISVILPNPGDFVMSGTSGNDVITSTATAGHTTWINGGAGNDTITGGAGPNHLFGGPGDDVTYDGSGPSTMYGGTGNDAYYVNNAADQVIEYPGGGNDTVFTSLAGYLLPDNVENLVATVNTPQTFAGNSSFDTITLGGGDDTVYAGSGGSYIIGNGGNDVLVDGAGGGNIYALGGNDYLQGGAGSPSDVLVATGAGNDSFYGGSGNNYIVGGTGRNVIVGGGGALQSLYGNGSGSGANGDYIVGGSGAGASNVLVENGTGSASLWGGLGGTNYEVGGAGNDLVVGGSNSDYLFGGSGDDTIYGGDGTDYIYPGPGNDFIWTDNIGSPQSTDYIYEGVGTGVDTIADFTPGNGANHDVLVMASASSAIASFADVQAKAFQAGVYTVLPLSNTDQVYLYNVQPFQLTANDFIFT